MGQRIKFKMTVSHWLPIVTRCPVNGLPDVIYIYVTFTHFEELYGVRKALRNLVSGKKMFMEQVAEAVMQEFPTARSVEVRLLTGRHVVSLEREYI